MPNLNYNVDTQYGHRVLLHDENLISARTQEVGSILSTCDDDGGNIEKIVQPNSYELALTIHLQ